MRKWIVALATLSVAVAGITALAALQTRCPFVNPNTGFQCMGIPLPDGLSVAGSKWKCSINASHRWITKD